MKWHYNVPYEERYWVIRKSARKYDKWRNPEKSKDLYSIIINLLKFMSCVFLIMKYFIDSVKFEKYDFGVIYVICCNIWNNKYVVFWTVIENKLFNSCVARIEGCFAWVLLWTRVNVSPSVPSAVDICRDYCFYDVNRLLDNKRFIVLKLFYLIVAY